MSASPAFSFPGRYKNGSACLKRCVAGASASKYAMAALHGGTLLLPVTVLATAKRGFLRPDEQFPQVRCLAKDARRRHTAASFKQCPRVPPAVSRHRAAA